MEPLPDRITRLSPDEAIDALAIAYERLLEKQCDAPTLAILTAQSALETGHWKSIHWYNFGNVKRQAGKPWTMFRCNEIIDGKTVWFDPPHPQTHFRAYADADDGAEEYIRFLAIDTTPDNGRPNRFARAWYAAENDDPLAFSVELHKAGYYTAAESQYTRVLVSCFNRYFKRCKEYLERLGPTELPEANPIDRDKVLMAVAATIGQQIREFEVDKWVG